MKIVFWGTPSYAIQTLESLINYGHEVLAVITQPDRKRGRGSKLQESPIKKKAKELGILVITPESIKNEIETQISIERLHADIYVVVAFGQILPIELLSAPTYGCWNAHGSLLPRWRGAGPIQGLHLTRPGGTKTHRD